MLISNSIDRILEDAERNFWFTSSRQGILRISRGRFRNLSQSAGLDNVVLTTTKADGTTASYTTAAASWVGPGAATNTWTYEFKIDPAETATAIAEAAAPAGYTCTASAVADSGFPSASGTASLTNAIERHTLTVANQVTGNQSDKTKAFNYAFTTNAPGAYDTIKTDASGSQTTGTIASGGSFALKDGESIQIQ